MTCDEYWDWTGSDEESKRSAAERHFAECASCQALRRTLESSLSNLSRPPQLDERHRRLWLQAAEVNATPMESAVAEAASFGIPPKLAASATLSRIPARDRRERPSGIGVVATLTAVALLALFALRTYSTKPSTEPNVAERGGKETEPIVSNTPVVTIPLTLSLCFAQIELDLDAAEARLEEVSQALLLLEVQRDVQHTLEEYRPWDD